MFFDPTFFFSDFDGVKKRIGSPSELRRRQVLATEGYNICPVAPTFFFFSGASPCGALSLSHIKKTDET